ncbi:MAG: type II secretion system protein GspC [Gammaproteobacteria bacterium]|nr:type II secretion system protein GspC [Gammaproteobacteria bacterium]
MNFDKITKYLNDRRLIYSVTLLLVVLLGYQLSILVWQLVPVPALPQSAAMVTTPQKTANDQTVISARQKIREIEDKNLFGKLQAVSVQQPEVTDAPESTLKYKLRGIFYSPDEALASVILEKDPRTIKFYRLGEEIENRIFIEQIQADHILISRYGKLEKLVLEKPTANLAARIDNRPVATLPASNTSKVLQSYKRRYSKDPMALAKRFKAIPVEENGQNIGYKLKALRGERLLQRLDIQDDDVFLAINGIGLDKPFQALDALKSLTTSEEISVTLLRNGNRETLNFNLQ